MNTHINNILVPTDFTEISLTAIEQAMTLAKSANLEITLLYVREDTKKSALFSFLPSEQTEKLREDYINHTREKLEELAAKATKKYGIKVNAMVSKGKGYDKIVEVADMINASFIIMPLNSGKHENDKNYFGANTSKVIRNSKHPVITLKSKKLIKEIKTIILPLDLQKETRQKVTKAVEIAKVYGSTIKIVSALLTEDPEVVNRIKVQLEQVNQFLAKNEVSHTAEIVYGDNKKDELADLILKYAKDAKGDLIMVMTQEEYFWVNSFVGKTATKILYKSSIPVMSINPIEMEITRIK